MALKGTSSKKTKLISKDKKLSLTVRLVKISNLSDAGFSRKNKLKELKQSTTQGITPESSPEDFMRKLSESSTSGLITVP